MDGCKQSSLPADGVNWTALPWPARAYSLLHGIVLPTSSVVCALYWVLVAPRLSEFGLEVSTLDVLLHGGNVAAMLVHVALGAPVLRLRHARTALLYGIGYVLFTAVWQLSGAKIRGSFCRCLNVLSCSEALHECEYIYHVLDWSAPARAATLGFGVTLLGLPICFSIWRLVLGPPARAADAKSEWTAEHSHSPLGLLRARPRTLLAARALLAALWLAPTVVNVAAWGPQILTTLTAQAACLQAVYLALSVCATWDAQHEHRRGGR